jgi:hypothetical protein
VTRDGKYACAYCEFTCTGLIQLREHISCTCSKYKLNAGSTKSSDSLQTAAGTLISSSSSSFSRDPPPTLTASTTHVKPQDNEKSTSKQKLDDAVNRVHHLSFSDDESVDKHDASDDDEDAVDMDVDDIYGAFNSFDSNGSSKPITSFYCIHCSKVIHEAKVAHDASAHGVSGKPTLYFYTVASAAYSQVGYLLITNVIGMSETRLADVLRCPNCSFTTRNVVILNAHLTKHA